ncbi:VOC family protein [Reyranella sp. CPCC 100927]|uniref:VOC family protein n=1 Tax=Reyranella sp. CPCC 100927 TaxID=2599616 RepID=UPI0015B422E4|nr:VOC family protein [Reyranella sp. CPCC 100927]
MTRLGYIGIEASDVPAWAAFAREICGFDVEAVNDACAFRFDERARRILVVPGVRDDLAFAGFEVDSDGELDQRVARLRDAGISVSSGSDSEAALRGVTRFFRFCDPNGTPFELAVEVQSAPTPFRSPLVEGGFVTGDGGLGHIVLGTTDLAASEAFCADFLGAGISDHIHDKIGPMSVTVAFLHLNPRHHSIAYAGLPVSLPKRLNHVMVEAATLEDVGLAYDRARAAGVPISRTLGQHPNDRMVSFYCRTPSGFDLEFGWGGVRIDTQPWTPGRFERFSTWGHQPGGQQS